MNPYLVYLKTEEDIEAFTILLKLFNKKDILKLDASTFFVSSKINEQDIKNKLIKLTNNKAKVITASVRNVRHFNLKNKDANWIDDNIDLPPKN